MPSNIPNNSHNVKTTITLVLSKMLDIFQDEIPNLNIVYDEKLDYESAVRKYRTDNEKDNKTKIQFPLLAFNRSILRSSEEIGGKRSVGMFASQLKNSNTQADCFRIFSGEFDVRFLYINPDISDIENFEIAYLSEEGISGTKKLTVSLLDGLGDHSYFLKYNELEDKIFENDENYYKMISGSVKINGFFLVFRNAQATINQINALFKDKIHTSIIYRNMQIP